MRPRHFWIEIVILGTAVACALALLFATLGAAAGAAAGDHETAQNSLPSPTESVQSFEGMVTCSRCGVRHSPSLSRSASICVRVCVHGGASFALVDENETYWLEGNLDVLKRLAGQRAEITGARTGQTIKVASAAAKG